VTLFANTTTRLYTQLAQREGLLPIRVTKHYQTIVQEEVAALGHDRGPLFKVAYPTPERLMLRAPDEVPDFVADQQNMPEGLQDIMIRKYRNRVLFLLTDRCAGHCMYCFRQDVLVNQHARTSSDISDRLNRLITYLQEHPEIQEVILSGGDPTNAPFADLDLTLSRLRTETSIKDIRVHTRNAVYAPQALSDRTCRLFGQHNVRLVLHIVHPYELTSETVDAIERAKSRGIRCYSQFPVLRGVNDHASVLAELLTRLDDLAIRPLSLFVADPINYSAPFRVSLHRLFAIMDDLNWHTSAWVNSVRLVLDTPIGKVRREDITSWDSDSGVVVFRRDGAQVIYRDFPESLDDPGDVDILLWKGQR